MNIKLIFLLFVTTFFMFFFTKGYKTSAQVSGKVIYHGNWPLSQYRVVEGKGELIFHNSRSFSSSIGEYKNYLFNEGENRTFEENDDPSHIITKTISHGDTSLMRNLTILDPFNIFVDLEKNSLFHTVNNSLKQYNIHTNDSIILLCEPIGTVNWILHYDQKKIGIYNCQKATTHFRGRDYTVWFTSEIPVSFGPWKLNGLPGLILEVSDATKEVYFFAISIIVQPTLEATINIKKPSFPEVELIEYCTLIWQYDREIEELAKEKARRIQARAPQGVTISYSLSASRYGIELDYEFLKINN